MISYQNQKKIELHISTWISQSGQLFDFNTKDFNEANSFKTCQYLLPIPKHNTSQHYYFLHQIISPVREEKNKFIVQRRKKFECDFNFQHYRARNFKLIGCFKVFMKQVGRISKMYVPHIKLLQTKDAKIKEGKQVDLKIENQKPYIVVKSFTNGYPIKVNQILKFGKTELKIKQIALQPIPHQIQQNQVLYINQTLAQQAKHKIEFGSQNQPSDDGSSTVATCRVCYEREGYDNPLINPCKCRGQIQNIHVECLKVWLETKLKNFKNQDQNCNVYNTKQLFCQICKQKLPKKIIVGNKQYILLNFMEQVQSFIALQNIHDIHANPNDQMFITFPDCTKTTIGRLDDNGMILFQNSVSRRHAEIYMDEQRKRFMLKDTDSKYGTLVYEKEAQFRLHSKIRAIQIGNSVFSFKIV